MSKFVVCVLVHLLQVKTTVGVLKDHLLILDSMLSQMEKEFEKFQTHFKSLGSVLPTDVSQIVLPHTQGYKTAFEGSTLF